MRPLGGLQPLGAADAVEVGYVEAFVWRSGVPEPPRSCAWLMLTEALGPRSPADDSDELPHHLLAVIVLDGVGHAAFDVVLQEEERHLAGGGGKGSNLLNDVWAVA